MCKYGGNIWFIQYAHQVFHESYFFWTEPKVWYNLNRSSLFEAIKYFWNWKKNDAHTVYSEFGQCRNMDNVDLFYSKLVYNHFFNCLGKFEFFLTIWHKKFYKKLCFNTFLKRKSTFSILPHWPKSLYIGSYRIFPKIVVKSMWALLKHRFCNDVIF